MHESEAETVQAVSAIEANHRGRPDEHAADTAHTHAEVNHRCKAGKYGASNTGYNTQKEAAGFTRSK